MLFTFKVCLQIPFLLFICSLFPTLFKIETAKSETAFFENLFSLKKKNSTDSIDLLICI